MATATQDLSCILEAFERNNYFYGKLMTVRDFEQEQRYHNGKRWLLNRLALGAGVLCGLEVVRVGPTRLAVTKGVALDACGREIVVPEEREYDLSDLTDADGHKIPSTVTAVRLCVAFAECTREPTPALKASTCEEVCEHSRIRETFKVCWRPVPTPGAPEGPSLCETWLNRKTVSAQNTAFKVERSAPLWARSGEVFEVAVKVTALQSATGLRVSEAVAGGTLLEPGQFPTPPTDLAAGEFLVLVYQVRAGAAPGAVTLTASSTTHTLPTLSSSVEVVADSEVRRREEFLETWSACGEGAGSACVDLAEVTVAFSGDTLNTMGDPDNRKGRRLVYSLDRAASLLECLRTSLLAIPGSPRPGHAFVTFSDLSGSPPQPVGSAPNAGTAFSVSRSDHVHALPLAAASGLEFTAERSLRINGDVAGEDIDFQNPVSGQNPTESRHLATKQYVDSAVAGLDWQESVLDKDLTSPPVSPGRGARYLLFSSAVGGAWSGRAGHIASWNGRTWVFTPPSEGMAVFVEDENIAYLFVDGNWIPFLATPSVTAGDGLTATGAVLSVGQGAGIVVNPNDVALAFEADPPRPVGLTPDPGTSNTVARGDHVHALPESLITGTVTGVVVFNPPPGTQEAVSGQINPGLGPGPILVHLGLEVAQNEAIFIGSSENFQGPKVPQVQLGAEVRPFSLVIERPPILPTLVAPGPVLERPPVQPVGELPAILEPPIPRPPFQPFLPRDSTFRVWVRAFPRAEVLPAEVRVRWWAFRSGKDLGEVIVSPPTPTRPTIETIPTIVTIPTRPTIETIPTRPTLETFPTIETIPTRPTIETIPTRLTIETVPTRLTIDTVPTRPTVETISVQPTLPGAVTIPGPIEGGPGILLGPGAVTGPSVIVPRAVPEAGRREISLVAVKGVSAASAKKLIAAGIPDVEALSRATPRKVATALRLTSQAKAKAIIDAAKALLEQA